MMIASKSGFMTRRLPYDAELEYLESTGTQWIDTGLPGVDGYTFKADFMYTSLYSNYNYLAGSGASSSNRVYFTRRGSGFDGSTVNTYFRLTYNSSPQASQQSVNINEWVSVTSIAEKGNQKVIVDGETVYTAAIGTTVNTGGNIYLFCSYYPTTGTTGEVAAKLGRAQFLYNGVLVRDFIPVRRGTTGYLYDRVSRRLFGNQGTGDFVLGPDVVPVEWLESDGNQYINTGIKPDATYTFDSSVAATSALFNTVYWGCRTSGTYQSENLQCYLNSYTESKSANKTIRLLSTTSANDNNWQSGITPTVNVMYHFDGMTVVPTMTNMVYPVTLFAFNDKGAINASAGKCRIGSWVPYSSGDKVASFRPVRVGTDATSWEGAMMDVLTRRVYRNAGTGAFTYGNDLKYPIPAE